MTSEGTVEGDQELGTADNSLGRLLALSDGVFAIAVTLLALDLHVPDVGSDPTDHALRHALAEQTPSYLSFLISFYVVAALWTRHRRLMRSVGTFDPSIVATTLFLLLCVAALPFPASLLGKYGSHAISLAIYGALNALAVLALLHLHYTVRHRHRHLTSGPPAEMDRNEIHELIGTLVVFLLCIPAGYVFHGKGAWVLVLLIVVQRGGPVTRLVRALRDRRGRTDEGGHRPRS